MQHAFKDVGKYGSFYKHGTDLFIQGRKAKLNQRERHQHARNKRNEITPTMQKVKKQLIVSNDYVRINSMVFKKPALEKQTRNRDARLSMSRIIPPPHY